MWAIFSCSKKKGLQKEERNPFFRYIWIFMSMLIVIIITQKAFYGNYLGFLKYPFRNNTDIPFCSIFVLRNLLFFLFLIVIFRLVVNSTEKWKSRSICFNNFLLLKNTWIYRKDDPFTLHTMIICKMIWRTWCCVSKMEKSL